MMDARKDYENNTFNQAGQLTPLAFDVAVIC